MLKRRERERERERMKLDGEEILKFKNPHSVQKYQEKNQLLHCPRKICLKYPGTEIEIRSSKEFFRRGF